MRHLYLLTIVFAGFLASGQDTISVLSYNILNYGSGNANKARYKDLRVLINYLKPDAILISEILDNVAAQLLLDSSFNHGNAGMYARSVFVNGPDTDNTFYYKTSKFQLKSQTQITTNLRDISQFQISHVISPGDTAWLYLHSAHLKAGSGTTDMDDRQGEVAKFCTAISSIPQNRNVLIGGDFNIRGNNDKSYETLTTSSCSHTFYDPINQGDYWYSSYASRFIHTQSTRSSDNPGCCGGATGGMDDRFDFILTNNPLTNGTNKLKVIPSSYRAVGNDGNRFNQALIGPTANSDVPPQVAQAIFNISDHLPVFCKFEVIPGLVGISNLKKDLPFGLFLSRDEDGIKPFATAEESGNYTVILYNNVGSIVMNEEIYLQKGKNDLSPYLNKVGRGMYIVMLSYKNQFTWSKVPLNN